MTPLYSNTLVTVSADISRGAHDMTWAELTKIIGKAAPEWPAIEQALMHGETYDMDGLLIYRKADDLTPRL